MIAGDAFRTIMSPGLFALVTLQSLSADAQSVSSEAVYTGDFLTNLSGGLDDGSVYLQNLDVTFELESPFGIDESTLFVYFLWNDDTTFSDRFPGDAQVVSNIDTEEALRLYEFWYEYEWDNGLNARVGLYDLNSEFDAIETAGLFINSSHGIGPDYSQTGQAGPSIFPVTSLTARIQWQLSERSLLRYALLDAVPGDPDDPSATAVQFNSGEGVLHALEFNHTLPSGLRVGVGGFLYSADFETIAGTDGAGNPTRDDGNGGVYGFVDGRLLGDEAAGREIRGFLRYGVANDELNPFSSYLGFGAVATGFLSGRPDDQLGIAVATVRTGSDFRNVAGADTRETSIELTYSIQVNDWLRLQPDVQYILDPGADPSLDNALVVGIRFEVGSGFSFD